MTKKGVYVMKLLRLPARYFWPGLFVFSLTIFFIYLYTRHSVGYNGREEKEEIPEALRAMDQWGDMRMYPFKELRARNYSKALQISKRLSFASRMARGTGFTAANTAPWTDLAPKNFAGRVLSMGFHPTDPNTMWVGSASGGLWKTSNGGTGAANGINWQYVQTGFPVLGVSSIIVGPDGNTLYIGTGELYQDPQTPTLGSGVTGSGHDRSFRGTYGIGILKSTDGGNTWTRSLDFSYSNTIAVMDMVMDPNNPSVLFAATTQGIYKTVNSGGSWTLISITGSPRMAMDLEYKPGSSDVLYASFGNFSTVGSGIYKTSNASSVSPVFTKLTSGLPVAISGKITLAVTPAAPNNVYASIGHSPTSTADPKGFYRSTNEGVNWSGPTANNIIGQQGWYAHDIAVSRTNADTIYWGELDVYRSSTGTAASTTFGIRSSWSAWNVNNTTIGTLQEGVNNSYVHADVHRILPSPHNTNTVFILTDGGVFRSTNRCQSFQTINGGLQTAQIYASAAVSRTDPNFMLMGMQDNEGLVYLGSPGCRRVPNLGDGFHAAINPISDNTCYIASYNLDVRKSTNRGTSFTTTPLGGFGDYNGPITACFNSPFVLAPSNPSTIYGGTALLRKSTDALGSVTVIGGTSAYVSGLYSPILTMAVSFQNANKMYCSTTPSTSGTFIRSKLWRTVTTSTAFTEKTDITGTLPDRYYTDIAVDPTDDQRIAVTLSGFGSSHVFLSLDGGNNWTDIGGGLPDIPHNSVIFDPDNRDIIYVGNDQGVYYAQGVPTSGTLTPSFTLDWYSYNEGLGDGVLVSDIVITNTRKLRLATYGRGLWERDMVAPSSVNKFTINNTSQCLNGNQFAFNVSSATCTGTLSFQWNFGDGNTATGSAANYSYSSPGTYNVKLVVANTSGCKDSATRVVTVIPSPQKPVITPQGSTSVCAGETVTLQSSATTGNQWYRNGVILTSSTASSLVVATSGSYTLKITNTSACTSDFSDPVVVTINSKPNVTVNSASVCAGDSITLTANGADTYVWSPSTGLNTTTGKVVRASPGSTSIYTVTGTVTSTNCFSSATSTVTIKQIPAKPSISLSGNQLLSSSSLGNQWFLNGAIASGLTTSTIMPPTSGVYTLQVTINGCASPFSDPYTFIYTGQQDLNAGERLILYPNPVKGEFYLDYYLNDLSDKVNIRVLNAEGRVVKEFRQIISKQNLFAGDLTAGIYLLHIETKTKRIIQLRFVKTN